MGLTRKQAKDKMLAAKDGSVSFKYPGREGRRNGILRIGRQFGAATLERASSIGMSSI